MARVDAVTKVMQEMEVELKKERPDLQKLLDLVHTVGILFHQQFASDERKYYLEKLKEYVGQVQVVVDGHTHKGRTVSLITYGAVSMLAAGGAVYGLRTGNAVLQKMCEYAGSAGQGANAWSQMSTDWKQAQQEQAQAELKLIEQARDYTRQESSEQDRKVQTAFESAQRNRELKFQIFSEFAR